MNFNIFIKKKGLRAGLLSVLCLLGLLMFGLFSRQESESVGSDVDDESREKMRSESSHDASQRQTYNKALKESLSDFANMDDVLEALFEVEGRNATTLALGYLLTRDFALLNELKRYSDSKIALEILASSGQMSSKERVLWARKLLEKDPENGIGSLYLSWAYLDSGNTEQFKNALAQLDAASKFDSDLRLLKRPLMTLAKNSSFRQAKTLVLSEAVSINNSVCHRVFPTSRKLTNFFSEASPDEVRIIAKHLVEVSESLRANRSLEVFDVFGEYQSADNILENSILFVMHQIGKRKSPELANEIIPGYSDRLDSNTQKLLSEAEAYRNLSKSEISQLVDKFMDE